MGRPFQKGNQAAKGRILPDGLLTERKLTRARLESILQKHVHMTKDELKAVINNPATPAIELMVVSVIHKAVSTGDQAKIEFLLGRISSVGTLTQKIEFNDVTDKELAEEMANDLVKAIKASNGV